MKLLLAQFKTNLAAVSRHTGISRERLLAVLQAGDFTKPELLKLLRPGFARALICGAQIGNFTPTGTANRQKVITNTYSIIINVHNVAEPRPITTSSIPQQ